MIVLVLVPVIMIMNLSTPFSQRIFLSYFFSSSNFIPFIPAGPHPTKLNEVAVTITDQEMCEEAYSSSVFSVTDKHVSCQ